MNPIELLAVPASPRDAVAPPRNPDPSGAATGGHWPFRFRDGRYAWFVGHPDWNEGPGVLPPDLYDRLGAGQVSSECRVYATLTEAFTDLVGALGEA